jgi:hypothetical protein
MIKSGRSHMSLRWVLSPIGVGESSRRYGKAAERPFSSAEYLLDNVPNQAGLIQ